ncbi:hypothetical protein O181_092525 [Austropuccinia psidii MF-1]|uniref:Uncharacterized protein n=1 Tax=Austropuccinia psidii MF-1 TaxID=1389203 RepID=A0A9Q3IYR4_9BASI|nr:hypothetical protein [Austropuccinia psidii MF-1]
MVHTRNGSRYSVQSDGPGQGRGNTRTRSSKSSSRKTHFEDARASPHSPRSVPTKFDVNFVPELIEGNVLRAEPLSSGRHRSVSVPIQKLVQRSKRREVGNMPKPLAGGHELLPTHQELSGSGEDHRAFGRMGLIVLQRQIQQDRGLVEEPNSFICRPEEGIGNDPSFGRPGGVYQLQKHPKRSPKDLRRRKVPNPSGKDQRQSKLAQTLPIRVQAPQIEAFSHGQCLQYCQNSYGIHSKRAGKDERTFPHS